MILFQYVHFYSLLNIEAVVRLMMNTKNQYLLLLRNHKKPQIICYLNFIIMQQKE